MRVRLRIDGRAVRRWHADLVDRIAARPDTAVEVDAAPGGAPWPPGADALFGLERLIHGLASDGPAAALAPGMAERWCRPASPAPDLIVDLCGDVAAAGPCPVWRLAYDGAPGEAGLLAGVLAGRAPVAELKEGERVVAAGRLGTEVRGVALTTFADGLSRSTTLILAGLDGVALSAGELDRPGPPPVPRLGTRQLGVRAARMVAGAAVRRLYRLGYRAPHWRVGWRRLDGPDLVDLRRHPETGWHDLPDDGHRFYADPFPLAHDGGCVLFVEDYIHAAGKGVISAVRFGPDGPLGTPEPVLEEPHHLSYPCVFRHDGQIWMVPESCAAGTVDLYRATAFPGGWTKVATLLSGIAASDATLFERDGRWWMMATVRHAPADAALGHGSYSDALHLWSAPALTGPWRPHARNPVLIDIGSARPAGRVVARRDGLIRPVQDCRAGYGAALALARIDRLDDDGYAQTVETVLEAGPLWRGSRLHTLNADGGFEFIDGSARSPRFWRAAQR